MKILLINPNSSPEITELVIGHARRFAATGTVFQPVTARFGPRYIGSRTAAAIAAHAALDAFAENFNPSFDAVLLACFGDPGIEALREICPVPAIGMAEAAMREAIDSGAQRVGVLTGGARWVPMLTEFYASLGLSARLASVRAVTPTGAQIAADPESSIATLAAEANASAAEDGANMVILGGAGLAGLAPRVQQLATPGLLDSLEASVRRIEHMAHNRPAKFEPAPGVETIGLGRGLETLMQAPHQTTINAPRSRK